MLGDDLNEHRETDRNLDEFDKENVYSDEDEFAGFEETSEHYYPTHHDQSRFTDDN